MPNDNDIMSDMTAMHRARLRHKRGRVTSWP